MTDPAEERCWRTVEGAGPRVVLVHGTMDRATSFGRVARRLEGYEVTRYDRRGYGNSLGLGPPVSFDQQVADLVDVLEGRPAMVMGHSYGGTIAAAAAQDHPEVITGIIAYEAPMPWADWWPKHSAGASAVAAAADPADAAERFMRRMLGDERWERLPPSTRAARRREGPTLVAEMGHLRPPNPPAHDPTRITVPVLAVHGTEGADHHHRAAEVLAASAPSGELVVLDGVGHGVHLTDPDEVVGLVDRLAETWRSASQRRVPAARWRSRRRPS